MSSRSIRSNEENCTSTSHTSLRKILSAGFHSPVNTGLNLMENEMNVKIDARIDQSVYKNMVSNAMIPLGDENLPLRWRSMHENDPNKIRLSKFTASRRYFLQKNYKI